MAKKLSAREKAAQKAGVAVDYSKSAKNQGKASSSSNIPRGVSAEDWSQLSSGGQAFLSTSSKYLSNLLTSNSAIPAVLDSKTLKKLYSEAQNDETIKKYYADDLATAQKDFKDTLATMTAIDAASLGQISTDQMTARKNLAEQEAAAGRSYSGFKQQAKTSLDKSQSDVITSTRAQIKSNLQSLTSGFEKKYGTSALNSMGLPSIPGVAASQTGVGIEGVSTDLYGTELAGTQATAKLADVQQKYQDLQSAALLKLKS